MTKKMNRRKFLKSFGAGAIVAIGAACAPAAAPTPAPTAPPTAAPKPAATTAPAPTAAPKPAATTAPAPAATAAPKPAVTAPAQAAVPSGRLVVGVAQWGIETPFPWRSAQGEKPLWKSTHDHLIRVNPATLKEEPSLALEWKPSADYKTWTFKLRQGVMFHENYGEFTSEDVKFAIEQHKVKPDAQGGDVGFFRNMLEAVETPDKYTVVMKFKVPLWEIPLHFNDATGYMGFPSKKYVESVGEEKAALHPIGTGPYRHVEGKQGAEHRFEAVPNHWRVTPYYKELVVRRMADPAARLAALRAGEIDIALVDGDYLKQAKRAGLKVHEVPEAAQYWVALSGQTTEKNSDYCPKCSWVGDPTDPKAQENAKKVRQALAYAVNKQAIIDNLWSGYGSTKPFIYWMSSLEKAFDQNWKVLPYDPAKAKQLLAEAGYPNGFDITVSPTIYLYAQDGPDVMEAIALDWEKIGIKVKRAPEDAASFLTKIRGGKTGPAAYIAGAPPQLGASIIWGRVLRSESAFHLVADGPFDKQIDAIGVELNDDKRTKLLRDFGQMLYDGYYGVMLGVKSYTWAVSNKVGTWPTIAGTPSENQYEYIKP